MKKLLTLATTLSLLLALSIPVLADDNTTSTNPAPTVQASPTDKATKAQKRLQNQQQFKQYMDPIRELQKQEKAIREQIHSTRNQVHQEMKSVKKAKNYTALSAALDDIVAMQDDVIGVTTATKTCLTDWQQYYTDRQAKNDTAIIADLQNLQSAIPVKITAMQKVLADLQKVSTDLNTPSSTPASATTSSTT